MPITYVRLVYTQPGPEVFWTTFDDLEDDSILFIDPVLEATSNTIGDLYRDHLARVMRMNDIIVMRGTGADFAQKLADDPVVGGFLKTRRGGALVGATADGLKEPVWQAIPGMPIPDRQPRIESLRQAEVVGILKRTGAIFESDAYHYVLPYQDRHAEKFIRLADALRSIHDINRILDWLLPTITGDTLVIGDTGSMLPLMVRLREHVQDTTAFKVEIATLDKYPGDRVDLAAAIDAIKYKPFVTEAKLTGKSLNYLFLISVSSSGRLCRLFRKLLPDSTIAVICRTLTDELPCEHHLATVTIKNWPSDRCEKCATHPRIYVDPQTYELLPHLEWKPVVVGLSKAREKSTFWSMVHRQQAVALHTSIPYASGNQESNRHFSVLLDTEKLARDEWFKNRCLDAIKGLGAQDLILVPKHKNSHVVARLCGEVFPGCTPHIVPPGGLQAELGEPLRTAKRILIADDAIVTGGTLFNFRSAIYKITQAVGSRPTISVFVMVSRPADRIPLESLERRYRDSEGVKIAVGEEIFLPEEQLCPWCKERDFLRSALEVLPADAVEVRESVNQRIEKLRAWPLEWPFFMLHDGHSLPPDPKAIGSFFGTPDEPLGPHAAFAAGACVAQTMKMQLGSSSKASKSSPAPSPTKKRIRRLIAKIWPLERLYLSGRVLLGYPLTGKGVELRYADMSMVYDAYFETTLLSSLLRTFDGVDVRQKGIDDIFERKLRVANPDRTYPGAVTELAYAALAGKIPNKAIRATLEKWSENDRWFRMLLAIMNAVEAR